MILPSSAVGKVVITDDEPVCIDLASRLMRRLGYDVTVVMDGALALEAVAHDAHDVILLDAQMPGVDGFEVCRRLKAAAGDLESRTRCGELIRREADQHKGLTLKTTDHGRPSPTMTDRVCEGFAGKSGRGERI
jgi:CheY-like chemotaxis protein